MNSFRDLARKALSEGRDIYIRGTSDPGVTLGLYFDREGIIFEGYVSNNPETQGKVLYGEHRCFRPDEIGENSFVFVAVYRKVFVEEIVSELHKSDIAYAVCTRSNIAACSKLIEDEVYIKALFEAKFGTPLDLENPKTFNEKNNWRKLHDRRPIYTEMVDKYRIKDIIAERVGPEHTFPLLGVWDSPEEVDFSALPDQFVLKVNHAGGVIVCRDKMTFDRESAIGELTRQLQEDYFLLSREWPYKNVRRKVICEQYMGENLTDYKNYCFNGKLQYTFVWENESREDGRKPDAYFCGAYDREWEKSEIVIGYPTWDKEIVQPECYHEMVRIVEAMSAGIPFVRVDCYIIDNFVYVGELTFFPWGGFMRFEDPKWNCLLGEMEELPGNRR